MQEKIWWPKASYRQLMTITAGQGPTTAVAPGPRLKKMGPKAENNTVN
ncbi:MAG: hypothetical protein ACYTEX_08460 [Planctomycetota bacterium]